MNPILADLDAPLVFRTAEQDVYCSTLESGSLWLRSDEHYQRIEDQVRVDPREGANEARGGMPMFFPAMFGGIATAIAGPGSIGQRIVPHYLACFHSTSPASTPPASPKSSAGSSVATHSVSGTSRSSPRRCCTNARG
ncbi:MAG: hypothetical protein WAT39_07265 [Planctomycetota bacterium]